MRAGALTALAGFALILFGVFSFPSCAVPGVPCPSPSLNEILAYTGLAILLVGMAVLALTGWRGSPTAWVLAAVAAVPATWFLYELGRQSLCPLLADPPAAQACLRAYGEMTAPVLSSGVAGLVLAVGWLRLRRPGRRPAR